MAAWEQLNLVISAHINTLVLLGAVLWVLTLALAVAALGTGLRLKKRYSRLMMSQEGLDLEGLLNHHGELLQQCLQGYKVLDSRMGKAEKQLQSAVAGVGLVRYNAFRETGSDLSFSLALLDRNLDGVVLTSLFGRSETRCYGKPVQQGRSNHHLSEEENEALDKARAKIDEARRRPFKVGSG